MHVSRSSSKTWPGFNSKVTAEFEDNWNKILEKHVFGFDKSATLGDSCFPSLVASHRPYEVRPSQPVRFDWKELLLSS